MSAEIDTTARTVWAEARGEGEAGMIAVAAVIANRVAAAKRYKAKWGTPHILYGDGTFANACKRRFQFSCWNPNDKNLPQLEAVTDEDHQFKIALAIARDAVEDVLKDLTDGATHYLTKAVFDRAPDSHWCKRKPPLCVIGNHLFFRNP